MSPTADETAVRSLTVDEEQQYATWRLRALSPDRGMPYLAAALLKLRPVAAPGLGTLAVDAHWRLYIDFSAVSQWGVEQAASGLLHEVSHVLRSHAARADAHGVPADQQHRLIYNASADASINDDLAEVDTVTLIDGAVDSETLGQPRGLTAEDRYDQLAARLADQPQGSSAQAGGTDDVDVDGAGNAIADGEQHRGGDAQQAGDVDGDQQAGAHPGGCGSGAGGPAAPCEVAADDADHPGMTDTEADLTRRHVADAVREWESSHSRGTVPAGLSRWADEVLQPPQLDWRSLLRVAVRRGAAVAAGRIDYSHRRLSRRRTGRVVLPGMVKPKPKVATILDTSGSMGGDDLAAAVAEVDGIARRAGIRGDDHQLLAVDAAAPDKPQSVRDARQLELTGGGGTDMRVGITAALDLQPVPDVIVCLSDGYTPWPDEPLPGGVPLICAIVRPSADLPPLQAGVDFASHLGTPEWAVTVPVPTDTAAQGGD